ncbi:MAG: hypothetical protein J1E78_01785 [Muribaculaceae bacterium]|nr:hypothetical protein [Muribaculaceae bacterium]
MIPLPEGFKEMIRSLPGIEAEKLLESLDAQPQVAVRLNKRKHAAIFEDAEKVSWCESGRYLENRPDFILDPLLHAGAYYVQDPSSMIYETVVENLVRLFPSDNPRLKILDLCAAPGGKTTAIINGVPDGSFIVANEISSKRVNALEENLSRWGYPYISITNHDSSYFGRQGENFDIVAVDAPCSGEGMMRKDNDARTQWSEQLICKCSSLQKEILFNAANALKPGGFLIYSTCTFNRKENEENAEFINNELGMEAVNLSFPEEWNIQKGIETKLPVYRFFPHKIKGEGLFLCIFRKPGEWVDNSVQNRTDRKTKPEKTEIPDINEILSVNFDRGKYPMVEIDKEKALSYLRRESIILDSSAPKGIVIVTYKGWPLGAAKNIGTRANNLYPKNRRILKR